MSGHKEVADFGWSPPDDGPLSPAASIPVASSPEAVNPGAPTAAPADTAIDRDPDTVAADAERPAVDRRAAFQELFDIIRSCTAPTILTTKWNFLGKQDNFLRIDMSASEFIEVLSQTYSHEALHVLGLLECVEGEFRLPGWLDGDAPLYVKLDDEQQKFTFFNGNEFLFPMTRSALDYALERIPPDSSSAPHTLFIVATQDDAEVMHRLGLPAVSGEGLEALSCQDIQRLFIDDDPTDYRWRYQLVLLDFDVTCLGNRPTGALGEVIEKLADAADLYGIDPAHRFAVCRPTPHEFRILEQALAFHDSTRIVRLFETLENAARRHSVQSWRTYLDLPAVSLSTARQALDSALKLTNNVARRAEVVAALPAYREAGRRAVLQKFHGAIDRATDPFIQVDLMAAAAYAEDFLDNDPLLRAAESVLTHGTLPSADELHDASIEMRQRSLVELRRIRREITTKR